MTRQEHQYRTSSGELIDVILSSELLEVQGEQFVISPGVDITDRKRNEQKLQPGRSFGPGQVRGLRLGPDHLPALPRHDERGNMAPEQ